MKEEDAVFEAYRRRPCGETLRDLLLVHQDLVYTICFTILKQTQDAVEIAQEALSKIASGTAQLRGPRAFRMWLCRISYQFAVEHLRQRQARRRTTERKDLKINLSLSRDAREAIHEAMEWLSDGDRLLLVEHYFEKASLEELGRREGISAPVVWKRMDRALGRLKRALTGAGFGLAAAMFIEALESVTPTAAPTVLVSDAMLEQATSPVAGGVVMEPQSAISTRTIIAALMLAGLGLAGGYLLGTRKLDGDAKRVEELETRINDLNRQLVALTASSGADSKPAQVTAAAPEPVTKQELPAAPTRPVDSTAADRVLRHPEDVKIGRPEETDISAIVNASTWEKFYKVCNDQKITGSIYEDLIFRRVSRELSNPS
ncbi:MAG: sigma-70 family RNA polymerase sigma factor [Planctomycetes bacterium]|nr:sigma-70 family RNA polymerase sigma factor [Planctomycetota bacterium]